MAANFVPFRVENSKTLAYNGITTIVWEVNIMMYCTKCGTQMEDGASFCSGCGAPVQGKMYCKHCGEQIDSDCIICPQCGKQVGEIRTAQPTHSAPVVIYNNNLNNNTNNLAPSVRMKNKWVALLLCLFLGYFGAHKFYEGKIVMGIVYIFTFGLFGVGAFIDFIVILTKPQYYY